MSRIIGRTTNNVAEYQALIETLSKALELGIGSVQIRLDSELVVKQLSGGYRIKKPNLRSLAGEAQRLLDRFDQYTIRHVPRSQNRHADALCNRALDRRRV